MVLKTRPRYCRVKTLKANESPHAYLPSDSSLDFSGVDCMTLDIHLPSRLSLGRRRLTTEVEGACLCMFHDWPWTFFASEPAKCQHRRSVSSYHVSTWLQELAEDETTLGVCGPSPTLPYMPEKSVSVGAPLIRPIAEDSQNPRSVFATHPSSPPPPLPRQPHPCHANPSAVSRT